MRENNLADAAPGVGDQFVDTSRECLLLVFIRRARIDNQQLFGVINEIAIGMSGGRLRRCPNWKADVVRTKLDLSNRFAMGVWYE
jgi:hypothetical protein